MTLTKLQIEGIGKEMTELQLNNLEVAAGKEEKQEVTKPSVNSLFASETLTPAFGGANQLNKTARLTTLAEGIAQQVFATATADFENFEGRLMASQKSHDAMDDLIADCYDLGNLLAEGQLQFLESESEEEIEKMIRSQQSKRSRAKSKVMTQENYLTMMTGAVAENLLRLAGGKPKSSGGGAVMGDVGYSHEDLEQLAQFPEELKKAIRNVQSKKSIMKSKAEFDPMNPRWQQLLVAEQQLKEVRDRVNGEVNEEAKKALEAKRSVEELLSAADMSNPDEAAELLNKVKEMLASN
jgi:hypothetical protein